MRQKILTDEQVQHLLAHEFEHYSLGVVSIRYYLISLLLKLWQEGEGFSSKRPFGDSGWYDDLEDPIIDVLAETFYTLDYDDIVEELILSL